MTALLTAFASRFALVGYIAAAIMFLAQAAVASCPAVPYIFTNGTPINATQVNADFAALRGCITQTTPIAGVSNTQAVRDLQAGIYPFVQRSYNTSPGDGAAIYYWSSSSTCADDGQNCIEPSSAPATGRWVLSSEVANALLLNPGGTGGEFLIQPTNQTTSAFSYQAAASGTVASTPTDAAAMALMWLKQEGALKGLGSAHQVATFEADYSDTSTGANNNDTYNGAIGNCNITTAKTGGGAPGTSCVGVTAAARAWAPQGGTPGSESGGVHGLNVVSGLSNFGTPPTDYNNAIGGEADLIGCTGCTLKVRWGWGAIDFGDGFGTATPIEHGSSVDAAFVVGSLAGPNYGWNYGVDFVGLPIYDGNPLTATGTVLGSSSTTPVVAADGIDLHNFVLSNAAFRCPSDACTIYGSGNIVGGTIVATNDLAVDATAGNPAVIQLRSATVPKWEIDREATTNDFSINNLTAMTADIRIAAATGVVSIGNAGSMTVNATGGVTMPGLSTSLGSLAGSICATAAGIILYKTGANCF